MVRFGILFTDEYEVAPALLAQIREEGGLSQREMARVLDRSQSHVQRMETRQRTIELVEFCKICRASGVDPAQALQRFVDAWDEQSRKSAA
ncbi:MULTISPECIES: helix-turn-helix domain-containing protein [unclassified Phenylobacterium]|uniref:helix-turn-helix domain-containing protein n=1 Tax=unclassified Phenylobacterium TaxID=2640670 RepID=UPI00083B5263|nr:MULTISPECIES: helix-turn-helix transcriptional regulator [unclassified Phenylobacterium]